MDLEAIAALRNLLGETTPALLISGDTSPDRLREAHASGIPILHKPVSPDLLYFKLVELLNLNNQPAVNKNNLRGVA
jgi:hypothetical protein